MTPQTTQLASDLSTPSRYPSLWLSVVSHMHCPTIGEVFKRNVGFDQHAKQPQGTSLEWPVINSKDGLRRCCRCHAMSKERLKGHHRKEQEEATQWRASISGRFHEHDYPERWQGLQDSGGVVLVVGVVSVVMFHVRWEFRNAKDTFPGSL